MGNCLVATMVLSMKCAGIRFWFQKKVRKPVVLLVVGLDNSGKTSVVNYLFKKRLVSKDSTVPTVGFHTVSFNYKSYSVRLFDVGGGPQIRALWPKYYGDVHGVIYVVDSNDHERLSESADAFQELACHELITQKPILFLGNKQDLIYALDELDLIGHMKIASVVNFSKCYTRIEICSCYPDKNKYFNLNKNINKGFDWLLSIIDINYIQLEERLKKKNIKGKLRRSLKVKSWTGQRSVSNSFSYSDTDSETYLKPIVPDMTKQRTKKRKKRKMLNNLFCITNNRTAPLPESATTSSPPTTKTMKELLKRIKIEDLINNGEIDENTAILRYGRPRGYPKRPRTAPPVSKVFEVIHM